MAGLIRKVLYAVVTMVVLPGVVVGAQNRTPRGNSVKTSVRSASSDTNASIRRSAMSVIARSTRLNNSRSGKIITARPVVSRNATHVPVRSVARVSTTGVNVSRAASSKSGVARSGVNRVAKAFGGISRSATARATAVFNDISKIGGGYNTCRDAYATCMDQFCANANDTYRRCFCSEKFKKFRDLNDAIDKATGMLEDFAANNLNAIDKTADEVNAMYSATEGEKAIRKDTSESQKILDEVDDILSGKKSTTKKSTKSNSGITGLISFGDFSDTGDIFSNSISDIFSGRGSSDNVSELEGTSLYQRAGNQCATITRSSCSSDAMFNLASSAYSIMITQDCNAFEKSIDAKKETVMQKVRKAEQMLREARLEEYIAHNSKDFNDCITKVEDKIKEQACGEKYEKCLDYTGEYVNATTGKAIYSQKLFKISDIAPKLGDLDIIAENPKWDELLEGYKNRATEALDSCRGIQEDVWADFKRMTIIRIAQAQSDLLEETKDGCIKKIKDCYSGINADLELADIKSEEISVDALRAITTRGACYDDVMACAALYGDTSGCVYDAKTKKLTTSKTGTGKCGLQSLLAYVDTVDSAKIAEACEETLMAKVHSMCDETKEDDDGESTTTLGKCTDKSPDYLRAELNRHAQLYCAKDYIKNDDANTINGDQSVFNTSAIVNDVIKKVFDKLNLGFSIGCVDLNGAWYGADMVAELKKGGLTIEALNKKFYETYYGGSTIQQVWASISTSRDEGVCLEASEERFCKMQNLKFENDKCNLTDGWFERHCKILCGKDGCWDSSKGECTIK